MKILQNRIARIATIPIILLLSRCHLDYCTVAVEVDDCSSLGFPTFPRTLFFSFLLQVGFSHFVTTLTYPAFV